MGVRSGVAPPVVTPGSEFPPISCYWGGCLQSKTSLKNFLAGLHWTPGFRALNFPQFRVTGGVAFSQRPLLKTSLPAFIGPQDTTQESPPKDSACQCLLGLRLKYTRLVQNPRPPKEYKNATRQLVCCASGVYNTHMNPTTSKTQLNNRTSMTVGRLRRNTP